MGLQLQWTTRSLLKAARHEVTPEEVRLAIQHRVYPRRDGNRLTLIGRTDGRHLFIVLEPSQDRPGFAEVVTAREATPSEKRLLARRGKGCR